MPERDRYVAEFLRAARPLFAEIRTRWDIRLDGFDVDGEHDVHIEAVITFRGRRFRYVGQVWPSEHPAQLNATLYVTHVQEKLLTRPIPEDSESDEPISL